MNILRSVPLRPAVLGTVLLVFGLLAVSLSGFEERQWNSYFERSTLAAIRNNMAHLQDSVGAALAAGDGKRAEREIAGHGFNGDLNVLAAVNAAGQVIYATRPSWRAAVASHVLPDYDLTAAHSALARHRPLIQISADHELIMAYYPLTLSSHGRHPHVPVNGLLYALIDMSRGERAVHQAVLKQSVLLWGATALAMLLLFLLLRRFVIRPVELMADAAGGIVRGQAAPFVIRGSGKIATLGHAFNEAAITARQLLAELREGEQRYRTIVEHVGMGIMLIDDQMRVLEINGTMRSWFPNADHVEHCYELFGKGDGQRCGVCSATRALSTGQAAETVVETVIGGERRILRIALKPVTDQQGSVGACVEIMEDITEKELIRHQLEKVTRALRALSVCGSAVLRARTGQELLQQVCDVIVAVGGYSMCWIGRAGDDAESSVVPTATAGGAKSYLAGIKTSWGENELGRGPTGTAIREGRPVVYQDLASANDNFRPWREAALQHGFRASAALPLYLEGKPYGALTIYAADTGAFVAEELTLLIELAETTMHGVQSLYDQQARRVSERELIRINAELERRVEARTAELAHINKELEAFTYSVSHDLRAPLRAIDGFSQILVQKHADALDAQATDYLHRVRRATQRMDRLIDDLLGLSRINRYRPHAESVDISAMAGELCRELQDAEPQRRVGLAIAPGLSAQTDAHLARIVLANLLGNAWKYSAKRADARIELDACRGDRGDGFVIRDNGVGFDMKYADKLFAPFQRLHGPSEFEGTGIGLATVQRAIERLHGHVRAEAAPDQGAAFFFCFNCEHADGDGREGG